MDIDANKVIEKLTQEIAQLILQKTIMVIQIEELQKENEMLKRKE
jgi:hypothetical protein